MLPPETKEPPFRIARRLIASIDRLAVAIIHDGLPCGSAQFKLSAQSFVAGPDESAALETPPVFMPVDSLLFTDTLVSLNRLLVVFRALQH